MQDLELKSSILIIAGMHRSGTSYVASLLQNAGFDIGENLLGVNASNLKGHFEDIDFLQFHESVLHSQGLSSEGWIIQPRIQVQEQYLKDAKFLTQERYSKSFWGWKDPRTTLFLDFWSDLLPEAKFLFVYRSPWEVLDSLYRRGDQIFFKNPMFALQIWQNYNQAMLDFYKKYPDKCTIMSVYDTIAHPEHLIEILNRQFNLTLRLSENLYDDSLFHRQATDSHRPSLLKQYFPEAIDLYQQLHETAKLFGDSTDVPLLEVVPTDSNYKTWLFQDWHDACRFEREEKNTKKQLQHTQGELEQAHQQNHYTHIELEQTCQQLHYAQVEWEQSLHNTQNELEQTRQQLHQTQAELEQTRQQYHQVQTELEQTRQQYHQVQTELEQTRQQYHQVQTELEQSHQQYHQTQTELEQSHQQYHQVQTELEQSHQQYHQTQTELEQSHQQYHQTQTELEQSHQQYHQTQAELEQLQEEITIVNIEWEKTQIKLQESHQLWEESQLKFKDLYQIWEEFRHSQTNQSITIEEKQEELISLKNDLEKAYYQQNQLKEIIEAMESSKFWKFRQQWFLLKKLMGLKVDPQLTTINLR